MDYRNVFETWKSGDVFDEETRREVGALTDEREIEDRFYRELTFGTGGMRGVIGAGTNRMNRYTVGKATQGLADYLNGQGGGSVVIAYDSRRMSREFALDSALILAANKIKAYLFDSLRPTPELSFAVRRLKARAGIVVTASHNPPEYNGYKVYSSDGGQIVPPEDGEIIRCIAAVTDYGKIKRIPFEEAKARGLLEEIGEEIDRDYLSAVKGLCLHPEASRRAGKKLKIVYTPLNGTGNLPVRRILRETGFENVTVVPEQEAPDGNFPTLELPNPEDPKAFAYALRLAEEQDADLVLATDPDADRLGVYAKDRNGSGEYMPFTGNMSGILIAEYLLSQRERLGLLPADRKKGAFVTTIVSTDMAKSVAKAYGLTLFEVLTGFKYIGEQMKRFEERGDYVFEFGFEESYGCLAGTHAHDKDAVAAVCLLCEAAAFYDEQGLTLCDKMRALYEKYGYFLEGLTGATLAGASGAEKIAKIMKEFREDPPQTFGGASVFAVRDYERGVRRELATGAEETLTLPRSNVLYFELSDGGWVCARPSGTEPKIKFYFGVKGHTLSDAQIKIGRIKADLDALLKGRL